MCHLKSLDLIATTNYFFLISEELLNEVRIKFLSGLGPTVRALPQNTNAAKVQGARAKYKSGSTVFENHPKMSHLK